MTTAKKRILSCIQPTGDMHLGNYFGAVKNWVDLQAEYDCFYGVVDYHAMTMPYDAKKLKNNQRKLGTEAEDQANAKWEQVWGRREREMEARF